jgi:hypothetical protein
MAEQKAQEVNLDALVTSIAKAVSESTAKAVADAESKVRTIEDQRPSLKSALNPTGSANRPKLARPVIFCGAPQREKQLSNTEIELFNQIKPGRYNNRKWEVIEQVAENDERTIEIRIPVKEVQDRIELAMTAPDLTSILKLIIAEQGAKQ